MPINGKHFTEKPVQVSVAPDSREKQSQDSLGWKFLPVRGEDATTPPLNPSVTLLAANTMTPASLPPAAAGSKERVFPKSPQSVVSSPEGLDMAQPGPQGRASHILLSHHPHGVNVLFTVKIQLAQVHDSLPPHRDRDEYMKQQHSTNKEQ